MENNREILLSDIAHARSGDKGNRLNIALILFEEKHFAAVRSQVTPDFVAKVFASRKPRQIVRYELPLLKAFNFVLDDVLEGGVNSSLGLDGHGKTLSFLLLSAKIHLPQV
jgi:hypothetical protein